MAWAANGTISQDPIEDGVEITEEQYAEGLSGMLEGKVVTIDGGFAVIDPPAPEPGPEPEPEPDLPITSVSARQFKLQLLAAGLIDDVEAWVQGQDRAIQIAYENSGSFVRDEPMMLTGFAALGFAEDQIDTFFTAASEL